MPGVTVIHEAETSSASLRPNEHIAQKAIGSIDAHGKKSRKFRRAELFSYLKDHPSESSSESWERGSTVLGSVENGMRGADKAVEKHLHGRLHCPRATRTSGGESLNGRVQI